MAEQNLSEKLKEIVEKIEGLTVLELHELVSYLEEKFGVNYAPAAVSGSSSASAEGSEEKGANLVSVILVDGGQSKVQLIKEVKDLLGIGLKEAKDIVDGAPKAIKENISLDEAEEIKKKLEAAGATIEIK
ncbi:MAG: 50S ribosomal protein L7/L12 [Candidatus Paceibacterota bacterium]